MLHIKFTNFVTSSTCYSFFAKALRQTLFVVIIDIMYEHNIKSTTITTTSTGPDSILIEIIINRSISDFVIAIIIRIAIRFLATIMWEIAHGLHYYHFQYTMI